MRKKRKAVTSNTKIAIAFFAFLALLIIISLIFKLTVVLRNGQFDSSRPFVFSITNGKNVEVVSLSPNPKRIAIFKFDSSISPAETGRALEIPIDGNISSNWLDLNWKINSLLLKSATGYNDLKTNLTIVDLLRIIMFAKSTPESSISIIVVTDKNEEILNQNISYLMNDISIVKDDQTIQIINATTVSGLGNKLARLITNIGGNVIIVATETSRKKRSKILYFDKKTYTVERLQRILGYETTEHTGNRMADIVIIIGEDNVDLNPF